jgi:predicted RNA-binding protein with RPS1 domain
VVHGKIARFANFGAFVELDDNLEGLCHISELSEERVDKPEDVVQLGQEMEFKILRIDVESKKIGLSARAVGKDEPIVDAKVYSSQVGSGMASLGELADFGLGKPRSEPKPEPEPEPEAEIESEAAPEATPEPVPETKPDADAIREPEPAPEPVSEPEPERAPVGEPEPGVEAASAAEPNTAPAAVSEPEQAVEAAAEPNTAPADDASGSEAKLDQ